VGVWFFRMSEEKLKLVSREVTFTPDLLFYHKQTRPPALDKNQLQLLKPITKSIAKMIFANGIKDQERNISWIMPIL
jgi:hypothetical protein